MKVLVAHPAQQHSYRLATALKRAGMLEKYATTVYYKPHSLTFLVAKLLKSRFRTKAEERRCSELPDGEVIQFCEGEGLLKLLALNTRFFKKDYAKIKYHVADRFAKRVARYAIRNNVDAVVTYDDSSPLLFEELKKKAPHILRIMDMSAANILYMRHIYERDMELAPAFALRLQKERSICFDPISTDRAEREIRATQIFLVPSDFVAKSLEFSGVDADRMYRCPYGVDITEFSAKKYRENADTGTLPVRFVYIGGIKELKGISYLLDAFMEIPAELAALTVIGQYDTGDGDSLIYKDRITFSGAVPHSQMPDFLKASDVFICPSLGEGMSLSALEAAACGLPLIVTENSGINDLMSGKEGFVIPIQSKEAIKEKVLWFSRNPEKIADMGKAARELALKLSWDAYYERMGMIFKNM